MSASNPDRDRRGADRYPLPKAVSATFGGFPCSIAEFSLTGCRIEHADRVTPRVSLPLKFSWRGKQVKIQATLIRSEMIPVRGKPAYASGIEFCGSPDDSPGVVRDVMAWLVDSVKKNEPPPPETLVEARVTDDMEVADDDAEVLAAPFLQCTLVSGAWQKFYVDKPAQPENGFTIPAPPNEREADVLCKAYERANAETRRAMRAQFQQAISRATR